MLGNLLYITFQSMPHPSSDLDAEPDPKFNF